MRLVLDAGHGGTDSGGEFRRAGVKLLEKTVVLDVVNRLERRLQGSSIVVRKTRDADVFVSLETRVAIANSWGADFFLSVHTNADRDADRPPDAARGFLGDPEAKGAECWFYSVAGRRWAEQVGRGFAHELPGEPWRGVRQGDLHVLRETNMTAVLAEIHFIDTSVSPRRLTDPAVLESIAIALQRAVFAL